MDGETWQHYGENLEENLKKAPEIFDALRELGLDINAQTKKLEDEGIRKFVEPYDSLMTILEEKGNQIGGMGS